MTATDLPATMKIARAAWLGCLLAVSLAGQQRLEMDGLRQPVEILRDRWGVPHIYAKNSDDLFFAQGFIVAKDRLFQIDLWRRAGTGKLSEVLGASAIARDRLARLVRYRGNWDEEWRSYSPDAKQIATAFVSGINAYIATLDGKRPLEFRVAGYDPGLWTPEDVSARVAGLLMTHNVTSEVTRSEDVARFGLATVAKLFTPDPPVPLEIPKGLELRDIGGDILRDYRAAVGVVRFPGEQGSNNWVVDGTMTRTGKPILANDPHRPVQIPSLRKTVHLVAPGWNALGAGEPALPGIALGHNDEIAFGFTIVGIDQQDLYVEKLNPQNPDEYWYRTAWKKMEIEREPLQVKGRKQPELLELRYTLHGPVIYEDRGKNRAYALRWVGSEPGGAGYLPALAVARAKNWAEFQSAMARYKVPSENIVYADRAGNIGWIAAGLAPVRKNWTGLFPVPGDTGDYEWSGFLPSGQMPQSFNPSRHYIATANHKILPPGYDKALSYEWAAPGRFDRIVEMLGSGRKFDVRDFARMQQDTTSLTAKRFQAVLRKWHPEPGSRQDAIVRQLLRWDGNLTTDSKVALIYEVWMSKLPAALFGSDLGKRAVNPETALRSLETDPVDRQVMTDSLDAALREIEQILGPGEQNWTWGAVHKIYFQHPLNVKTMNRGPFARPGDGSTVNATSGLKFQQSNGASYRQIIDLSDWDRSIMTNVPGEVGNPGDPHYSDLIEGWKSGQYHPMPFSRKAVEAVTEERILMTPKGTS